MPRMSRVSLRPAAARLIAVGALAVGLAAPATANAGVLDSVQGWWPMYEGSGQTIHDLSGKGNNGTLGSTAGADDNDPSWIRGVLFGSALRFGGDDFVRIPTSPALAPANLTVSAWIRGTAGGAYKYVLAKGANGCNAASYGIYTDADGLLRFYVVETDGTRPRLRRRRAGRDLERQVAPRRGHLRRDDVQALRRRPPGHDAPGHGVLVPGADRLQRLDDGRHGPGQLPGQLRPVLHGRHRRRRDLRPGAADRQVLRRPGAPVPQAPPLTRGEAAATAPRTMGREPARCRPPRLLTLDRSSAGDRGPGVGWCLQPGDAMRLSGGANAVQSRSGRGDRRGSDDVAQRSGERHNGRPPGRPRRASAGQARTASAPTARHVPSTVWRARAAGASVRRPSARPTTIHAGRLRHRVEEHVVHAADQQAVAVAQRRVVQRGDEAGSGKRHLALGFASGSLDPAWLP